jgi:hypothetical protein
MAAFPYPSATDSPDDPAPVEAYPYTYTHSYWEYGSTPSVISIEREYVPETKEDIRAKRKAILLRNKKSHRKYAALRCGGTFRVESWRRK